LQPIYIEEDVGLEGELDLFQSLEDTGEEKRTESHANVISGAA